MLAVHDMGRLAALTSLSPADCPRQRAAVRTWSRAGLQVRSFNHPSEIPALAAHYRDIEFVPVRDTAAAFFGGRHFVPIRTMLDWAAAWNDHVLLINADVEIGLESWELQRARYLSDGGLCFFIRHNYVLEQARATPERYGIDAFLLHGRDAILFPESFLSMGQPSWDYWLPRAFLAAGRTVLRLDFPAIFHQKHERSWSGDDWRRCVLELARVLGERLVGEDQATCLELTRRLRAGFTASSRALAREPFGIREWVERTFSDARPKMVLELGAHCGHDTEWLAALPGATVHAFEPDPRNSQPPRPNVTTHAAAVSDRDGVAPFVLSAKGWGREWTYSSSLRMPKGHLQRYPVTFGDAIEVPTVALDSFDFGPVDFVWADVQGAEREVILGARRTLERTRFLYTEYSDEELYEGQPTLHEILALLPGWHVVELWPGDVLLENRRLST